MCSSPRKLRILCLHGYRQNDQFFREKTGGMRKLFKKYADFFFVNAPNVPSVASTDRGEVRGWWFSREENDFSSRDKATLATGYDQSIQTVLEYIHDNGPFDGILGFSQGASMSHLLLAMAKMGEIHLPIEFAIIVSGFLSLSTHHSKYADVMIDIPTLHIYGIGDEVVLSPVSKHLKTKFSNVSEIIHDGGHFIPSSRYKIPFATFLEDQQKKLCI